jgi:hypothetical protein
LELLWNRNLPVRHSFMHLHRSRTASRSEATVCST